MGSARPKNPCGVRSTCGKDTILPNNHGPTHPEEPALSVRRQIFSANPCLQWKIFLVIFHILPEAHMRSDLSHSVYRIISFSHRFFSRLTCAARRLNAPKGVSPIGPITIFPIAFDLHFIVLVYNFSNSFKLWKPKPKISALLTRDAEVLYGC